MATSGDIPMAACVSQGVTAREPGEGPRLFSYFQLSRELKT
jgi:hypothetical protein